MLEESSELEILYIAIYKEVSSFFKDPTGSVLDASFWGLEDKSSVHLWVGKHPYHQDDSHPRNLGTQIHKYLLRESKIITWECPIEDKDLIDKTIRALYWLGVTANSDVDLTKFNPPIKFKSGKTGY